MDNKQKPNNNKKYLWIIIVIVAALVAGVIIFLLLRNPSIDEDYSYQDFLASLQGAEVEEVNIEQSPNIPTGTIKVKLTSGEEKKLLVEDVGIVANELRERGIRYMVKDVRKDSMILSFLPSLVILLSCFILYFAVFRKQMGDFSKKSEYFVADTDITVKFQDVAGLIEEKGELEEIVSFLKYPEKYQKMGAKIPKGVMLVGPPGTGKTMLAKAIAGEAGVPFYQISGSEFEEVFVGVGASRVRSLFKEAKKNAPAIIFIDEIDAVARQRKMSGASQDATAQTLNQILVEMDGFKTKNNLIVLAATNRIDVLDPAILRAGRFDRKVFFNNPDVGEREAILKLHMKDKPFAEDVDMKSIAMSTAGFSGADLANLVNEAAILAVKKEQEYITQDDIEKSFIKVGVGTEKTSKVISEKEKCIAACHETGHALLFHLLPEIGPVHLVSIIPTGSSGGFTVSLPDKNEMFQSQSKLEQHLAALLGGRIAESLIFGDITTGASQDLSQAMDIATAMVTKYGMSNLGNISYEQKPFSEATGKEIDDAVKKLIFTAEETARTILTENKGLLLYCADALLHKEKISGKEFEDLVDTYQGERIAN